MSGMPDGRLAALQRTLAAEHAAVYLYGVVGGRVPASREPALAQQVASAYVTHRGRRDQLTAMVRASGGKPVAAEVSYALPTPCRTAPQLRAAARDTEARIAEVYAAMVGATSRAQRQWAIDALADAAVRELGFGAGAEPFPGVAEL
jgi:hypothetical protein